MHLMNEIIDGYYRIIQEMTSKRVTISKNGQVIRTIQPGRILSLDELHDMLMKERTEMSVEGMVM